MARLLRIPFSSQIKLGFRLKPFNFDITRNKLLDYQKARHRYERVIFERSTVQIQDELKDSWRKHLLCGALASSLLLSSLQNNNEEKKKVEERHHLTSVLSFIPLAVHADEQNSSKNPPMETLLPQSPLVSLRMIVRSFYLGLLFLPNVMLLPLVAFPRIRTLWWRILRQTLEWAGPCWIKLGQWASTRPDLFSEESCQELSILHDKCPTHSMNETTAIIEKELGRPIDHLFQEWDPNPIASGAIAQVYHAVLWDGTSVAVKVRHPSARLSVLTDLAILNLLAKKIDQIPSMQCMSLIDSAAQFTENMLAQLDMRREAKHLKIFRKNFKRWPQVVFPRPIESLNVSPSILVESFEGGEGIGRYLNDKMNPDNIQIADIGINAYMKMMLKDHFIHADLHPGNILVRRDSTGRLQLVMLDVGLVTQLSSEDADHFVQLFKAIVEGDGRYGTELMIKYSREPPGFKNSAAEERFKDEMDNMFQEVRGKRISEVEIGKFLGRMFSLMRTYRVKIEGNFATLMVGTVVLEGMGRQLNPQLDFITSAIPYLYNPQLGFIAKVLKWMGFETPQVF